MSIFYYPSHTEHFGPLVDTLPDFLRPNGQTGKFSDFLQNYSRNRSLFGTLKKTSLFFPKVTLGNTQTNRIGFFQGWRIPSKKC